MYGDAGHANENLDDDDRQQNEECSTGIPLPLLSLDSFAFLAKGGMVELLDVYSNWHGDKECITWLRVSST